MHVFFFYKLAFDFGNFCLSPCCSLGIVSTFEGHLNILSGNYAIPENNFESECNNDFGGTVNNNHDICK